MIQHAHLTCQDPMSATRIVDACEASPAELARAKLRASPYVALRGLACDNREGILAIHGRVPTYFLKQLAQVAVADVPGIQGIKNLVEVGRPAVRDIDV